jgi:hypothetical protein
LPKSLQMPRIEAVPLKLAEFFRIWPAWLFEPK